MVDVVAKTKSSKMGTADGGAMVAVALVLAIVTMGGFWMSLHLCNQEDRKLDKYKQDLRDERR